MKKSCESLRLPEAGYHVSPNSNTLSPALCVGYATFTDQATVSSLLVSAQSVAAACVLYVKHVFVCVCHQGGLSLLEDYFHTVYTVCNAAG